MTNSQFVPGEFVLQDLFTEFTFQVNRKIDLLLTDAQTQDSKLIMKSLQRGEDAQFDQLLGALGCVAEYCLPSLLETLFKWFNQCVPNGIKVEGKISTRSSVKSKTESVLKDQDSRKDLKEMIIVIVFCLVLIEVLQQLSVHPLPEHQIQYILSLAFSHFRNAGLISQEPANSKARIVVDLFAEVIGVMAKTKFQHVRGKFMSELEEARKTENSTRVILGLIMGMKFFRVKMYPVEDFEASFRFLRELADYSLEVKDREIKHGLASLFVEILVPVAAAVKTEVNVPVLRDFVDALYPTSLELARRRKNQLAMYPLVTCLLCVSQKQFFLNNWHIFLDNCLSNLKNRDQKISRVALESLYRILWSYTVRIKCESNTATQSRLQSIIKALFPAGSRSVVPKDTPLSIYVKIIQFIAQERLDFAMKEIILDLLCLSPARNTKIMTLQPERMNIGLRAFLVITDSLQQKDGAPPMPTTVGVMPSGNTLRVKKTFLNKMLTDDDARTIGVQQYHKHIQKALEWILVTLDGQVGQRMMMTNRTSDVIGVENKPKIDLFRTCIAAMPRLVPFGNMTPTELFELLSRLTIHIDEDLRLQAFTSLLSFAQDFPDLREDVVATYVSFILKQVTDIHHVLLETVVKHLMQLISGWQSKSNNTFTNLNNFTPRSTTHTLTDSHERRSKFAPLIHHLEGFALVLLCNNRSATRKLACLLLKEVKELARTLNYKNSTDDLCIDVLDRLCPVVASEVVLDQEIPHYLSTVDCKNVLAVAERCDISALIECTSACSSNNNVDLWTSFVASFMKPNRIPAFCPAAVEFSWANANVRLNQLYAHMDPIQTSSNKKGNAVPSSSDAIMSLWTNYVVFACRSAPTNTAVIKKQTPHPVAAGTCDWLVALSRDSERITATPSALFQRLITLLRLENNVQLRDSAVVGLGSTSIVSFPDLMIELLTVIQEASKPHRQDNMRRKRKRDNTRVMLAKVMERLARHKVLSECAASTLQLPSTLSTNGKSSDGLTLSYILLEYIKDTCSILESVDKSEFPFNPAAGGQQPAQQAPSSPFPGTLLSSSSSVQSHANTPNLMDELRIHFGSMISFLMRHLPDYSHEGFLPNETRRVLFFLFSRWCGKYGDALDNLDLIEGKESNNVGTLLHLTALKAECAVLCSGPLFDKTGLQPDNGYLYSWLEVLLDYNNPKIHRFGKEAVVMLLRHNRNEPALLSWLIDKCYTGSPLIASGCFCSIAAAFNYIDLNNDMIALLNLALFNIANSDVCQTAQHLLVMIQSRLAPNMHYSEQLETEDPEIDSIAGSTKEKPLQLPLNVNYEQVYTPPLYCLSQEDISKDLARLHPEFTIPMLSEIFKRFMLTTTTVWQQLMLNYLLPWLMNVELTLHDDDERVPELNNSEKMFDVPLYMLGSSGWGSVESTRFILSNLTYMTIRYHTILGNEIEECWRTLCHSWPGNLEVLLVYVSALSSCGGSKSISFISKKLITFFARAKPKEVAQYLVTECQESDQPNFAIEIFDKPPFLNIVILNMKLLNRLRPFKSSSPPRSLVLRSSKKNNSANILSSSAPTSYLRIHNAKSESNNHLSSPLARPSKRNVSLNSNLPHHMSLQQLNTHKNNDFDLNTKPVSMRVKASSSLYSLPIMNSEGATVPVSLRSISNNRLSHHEPLNNSANKWPSTKERETRSAERQRNESGEVVGSIQNVKDCFKNVTSCASTEFVKWRQQIDLGRPCALPIISTDTLYYFQLNEYFVTELINKSNGLLRSNIACVLLSEIVAEHGVIVDWKMYLPVLLLSLFLGMDVEYENVPQKCQFMLGHVIIQLLSLKDQALFASSAIAEENGMFFDDSVSLNHLKKGTTPTSVSTTDSGIGTASSPKELPLFQLASKLIESTNQKPFDIQTLSRFIQNLLEKFRGQLWVYEDASPKNTVLKSTDKLISYVSTIVAVMSSLVPEFDLADKLSKQALRFSISTPNKHCASRALQVYRSLKLPLKLKNINDLSLCLSECIADGNDPASQSWSIEILLTMLQTCELSCSQLNKEEHAKTTASASTRRSAPKPPAPSSPSTVPAASASPESLPQSPSASRKSKTKMSRRGHVHRRSGSVSISKQILEETRIVQVSPTNLSPTYEATSTGGTSTGEEKNNPQSKSSDTNYPYTTPAKTRMSATQLTALDETKNGLAQIFWIAVGILESDFDHEYLIALHIIQKILLTLKLNVADGRMRLERSFYQIQWNNFKGLQSLLLKGLTCSITFETAFAILCNLTIVTHLPLVTPFQEGEGFAINVIALLPRLVNQFGDPDLACCDCAQNIAQVCVEHFKDHIKLQSLAHVMSLYSNNTYNKSAQTWINVVCKYVFETFPQALSTQLTFLLEMLDKGHSPFHQACLHITHSLLSLSPALTEINDGIPIQEILHVAAKHLNTKHWKDALAILKLAVCKSSQLASPASAFTVSQRGNEKEKIELPGLTLSFTMDLSETSQELSPRRSPDNKELASPLGGGGWRRPHLSQRRTRERLRCVLSVCSLSNLQDGVQSFKNSDTDVTNPGQLSDRIDEASSQGTEDNNLEEKAGVDDYHIHGVFRDFDFLNEIEEIDGESNDFNQGLHWNSSNASTGASNELLEQLEAEEPDECDLTPALSHVPDDELDNQLSDTSDGSGSSSSSSSFVGSYSDPEDNGVSQSSTEFLASDTENKNVLAVPAVNGESEVFERKRTFSNRTSPSTYIRAVSPRPPGVADSEEKRIFVTRKSITEQVYLNSESESSTGDDLPDRKDHPTMHTSVAVLKEFIFQDTSSPTPPESSNPSPEKDRSSSFHSLEQSSCNSLDSMDHADNTGSVGSLLWADTEFLHAENLRWKMCLNAVGADEDGNSLADFFLVFPSIYRSMCIDFSVLSKEGCNHLGKQHSSVSNNFSANVDSLPNELECPLCIASAETFAALKGQLKSELASLEEQLDFYSEEQGTACSCLEAIASYSSGEKRTNGEISENDEEFSLEQKQLELCRLLYTLHLQLLLIFQSFTRLVHVVSNNFPKDPTFNDPLITLHKKLIMNEDVSDLYGQNPSLAPFVDVEDELRSMTNEEASSSLLDRLLADDFRGAHIQLCVLRKLWPIDIFGSSEDSASNFLISLYFKNIILTKHNGGDTNVVVFGENANALNFCEKSMSVIQESLQVLKKTRGKFNGSKLSAPNDCPAKTQAMATPSSLKLFSDSSSKRTSF